MYDPEKPPEWETENLYLQILIEGFIGPYGGSSTSMKADRIVRAFCGLGIALRLFTHEHYFSNVAKPHYYIHKQNADGSWSPENRLDVDDGTGRGLIGLAMHTLDGRLQTEEAKYGWADHCLRNISVVFSADEKADQIRLASQWLFDSHTGQDQLLAFIQAMIVLEILLGDKALSDEIGVGQLIRNRCAYLIGASHQMRAELLEEFNAIYQVRSQIVHSGKQRLTLNERRLFLRLRWMCRRVVVKEIELLEADLAAKT